MLTRSTRALPPDFNPNQPVGRRIKPNPIQERAKILADHPTLPAAFPTLDRPPPPPERRLWVRGASAAADDGPKNKRRRIDMTEDDLLNELYDNNEFLDAQIGCKEVELPLFGQGDYKQVFVPNYNEDNKIDLGVPVLSNLNPGQFNVPLFYDEERSENWGLDVPATCTFKDLANGVKMAIVIEATELYKANAKVCAALMLNDDDIDDYIKLYEREAENDANHAYNIQMEEEWEMMHRMAGRTDFANYYPPDRKPTFRSALSLIRQKDVDAGQRYLNMVSQIRLVSKLEDYVGCAGGNTFSFKHAQASARRTSSNYPAPESVADSVIGDNHSAVGLDEDEIVRDGRGRQTSNGSLVVSHMEAPVVQNQPMAPPPSLAVFNAPAMPAAQPAAQNAATQPIAPAPNYVANWPKNNLNSIPLLAQPPRRRRLIQGRPEQPKLPLPSYTVVEDQQPHGASPQRGHGIMPAAENPDTPPPDVLEFAREMSSTTRRTPSRPDDEPEFGRTITSSPIRMAFVEPRRPRVAHLDREGQNPSRHSSGTGSPIERTNLKVKRQLSDVYRPERQWAEQAPSSSPLRATTPRSVTPRTGSKQYFLSEQSPAHPPSSPRLFDESGKTVREKLPSPEEVARIFRIQEQEARKQRQLHLGQAKPGESPILPLSTAALGYQAPFSSQRASTQQPPQPSPAVQTTPSRPRPILPPATPTAGTYQPMFANMMKSKELATSVAASPAPTTRRQTTPILPPPRRASLNNLAPYSAHNIADLRPAQVGGPTTTSTAANDQSQQRIPQGASVGGSHATIPLSPPPVPQAGSQQRVWTQGQNRVQQQATGQPPQIGPPKKAPAPRQKIRRSKTTAAMPQADSVSPAKFESGDKARGKTLKSTYKPPSQAQQIERPLCQPNYARAESGPNINGSMPTPQSLPTTPQLPDNQAEPNTMKGSQSTLPSMGNGTLMAGPQPSTPHPGGISFYKNSFSAHSKATFDRTVQEFARDPPKQNYNNQHTKNREVNPLQAPQDFSAPRRGPKSTTSNGSGEAVTHPNPFRGERTGSQASSASASVRGPLVESHAAQYYGHPAQPAQQPQQLHQQNRLQRPFQPPAKKQKVAHEPVGTPERPHWDRNNRVASSPAQPPPTMAAIPQPPAMSQIHNPSPVQAPSMVPAIPQIPAMSSSSGDTTPKPNMPNGCMSGLMGVPTSEHFAQAMKNHGVQLPGQLAQQAAGKKKRNVGAKMPSSPPQQPQPQLTPSQVGVMMAPPGSTMTLSAPSPAQDPPETPKKGPWRPRGAGTKRSGSAKKKEVDPKQTSMKSFLPPSQKPYGGGGGMI